MSGTSFNTYWDVEKHKLEYECDDHWELRKNFLEAHKDKYPEDQLVCLAQVFTNVELLGCKYPKETMDLVAELSQDVAKEYREKQRSKLQRTFVKASDAASSKAKGHNTTHTDTASTSTSKRCNEDPEEDPSKRMKITSQPFGNLVLLDYPNSSPQMTLDSSVKMSGQRIEWKFHMAQILQCRCEFFINGKKVSEGAGNTKKASKADAAKKGLAILQKYYYTIEIKDDWKVNLTGKQSELKADDPNDNSLQSDGVGAKLMKLMGWAGGGLGKSEQGITEPVTLKRQISRSGFGLKLTSDNMGLFKRKCQQTLSQYIRESDTHNYLVFADFTNDERSIMHDCARRMGLKSQSHGPKHQRTLLITRKLEPSDLVKELLKIGGITDKYILKAPTDD
ncbi:Similar to NKRF: NF-kappa-B-repressing factor (Homo sapiens) [Cotesia congregata]|uniref:Similar to NKRF: NF-kappa-B-repressing factor (Homo sapiens) n=1 Tax=Cotesia congregata TaxID=51543 RepID=A0A8J2HPS1_COTCN|nr:Similar to NKRF: NF-kappa-B-repressing factor (Homo sapiens) [Cotesia congregata]